MAGCVNHPIKPGISKCRRCQASLCIECRRTQPDGAIYCSDTCWREFKQFQQKVNVARGPARRKFSILGALRTLVISAVLLAVIWTILVMWLGSSDPDGMWAALKKMGRVLMP